MNKVILITRPNHDETTDYLHKWSEPVIKLAKDKLFTVLDLVGPKARRNIFESYSRKKQPHFFFLNGHGSETIIAGQNNEHILIGDENDDLCEKAIVFMRSCNAVKILGVSLVKKGTKACIGYTTKFGFLRLLAYTTHPLQDPLAGLFLEPSNKIATTLLKGHTVVEAHKRGLDEMKKNLRKMLSSAGTHIDSNAIVLLWTNIRGQTYIGDSEATI